MLDILFDVYSWYLLQFFPSIPVEPVLLFPLILVTFIPLYFILLIVNVLVGLCSQKYKKFMYQSKMWFTSLLFGIMLIMICSGSLILTYTSKFTSCDKQEQNITLVNDEHVLVYNMCKVRSIDGTFTKTYFQNIIIK